jgi:glutaredoxin-related protein
MTKIYIMESCPDCTEVKQLYKNNPEYELIDIGQHVKSLKEFLVLRDHHPAFAKVRKQGNIGIPCFVKDNGTVTIAPKHHEAEMTAAQSIDYYPTGAACNLDGTGC